MQFGSVVEHDTEVFVDLESCVQQNCVMLRERGRCQ